MTKRVLFIVLAVLILLIVACIPQKPAPAVPAKPNMTVLPEVKPVMQPARNITINATMPKPAKVTMNVTLKQTGQATIKTLTPGEKKLLNDKIAIAKVRVERLDQKIALMRAFAEKQNNPELLARVQKLEKIYKGNTILVLLDKIDAGIDAADENLDEDAVRLREEMDAMAVIMEEIMQMAQLEGDPAFTALATEVSEIVEDVQDAYQDEFLNELEQTTETDLDENPYYETLEEQVDQQLEQEYEVYVEELEHEEEEQEQELVAETVEQSEEMPVDEPVPEENI